jgi:hypothetical protein
MAAFRRSETEVWREVEFVGRKIREARFRTQMPPVEHQGLEGDPLQPQGPPGDPAAAHRRLPVVGPDHPEDRRPGARQPGDDPRGGPPREGAGGRMSTARRLCRSRVTPRRPVFDVPAAAARRHHPGLSDLPAPDQRRPRRSHPGRGRDRHRGGDRRPHRDRLPGWHMRWTKPSTPRPSWPARDPAGAVRGLLHRPHPDAAPGRAGGWGRPGGREGAATAPT